MKRNNTAFNIILWVIMAAIAAYLLYTASDLFRAENEPLIPENVMNFREKEPETVPSPETTATIPRNTTSPVTTIAASTEEEENNGEEYNGNDNTQDENGQEGEE